MITRKMIFDGYYKGLVKLIESPHNDGIVCQIGDTWFYFGGLTAEECKTVEEYKANVDTKIILDEIYSTLNDFKDSGEELKDEYLYYEYYLKEKGIKEMKDVKELTREELNELKASYLTKLKEDESPSYQNYVNAENIPDEIIFEEYSGITFVKEDFFCNLNNNDLLEMFYKKLDDEIEQFRNNYKTMDRIQIYEAYYIIGFYETIHDLLKSDYIETNSFETLNWLSKKDKPLEFLYDKWMSIDDALSFDWDDNISWIKNLYIEEA